MAVDIRRMSHDELDALNESGRAWRERNKRIEDKPVPTSPIPTQLDLWEVVETVPPEGQGSPISE